MVPMPELEIHVVPVAELIPYANNAKTHPEKQVGELEQSITDFGFCDPIGVWHNEQGQMEIVEGHGRVLALEKLGIDTAPVIFLDHLTDEQRRIYTHVHNQTTLSSDFDYDALIADMDNLNADWESYGFEEYLPDYAEPEAEASAEETKQTLKERFGFTPFSVIMTTASDWMNRKHEWMQLGIRSEEGRGGGLVYENHLFSRIAGYRS